MLAFLCRGLAVRSLRPAYRSGLCALSARQSVFLRELDMTGARRSKRVTRSASRAADRESAAGRGLDEGTTEREIEAKSVDASRATQNGKSDSVEKEAISGVGSTSRKRKKADAKGTARPRKATKATAAAKATEEASKNAPDGVSEVATEAAPKAAKKKRAKASKVEEETNPDEVIETTCSVPWGAYDSEFVKIVTWNIASCRTALKNGFLLDYLRKDEPDILLVQETKMTEEAVEKDFPDMDTHDVYWNHCTAKKGYSGVAVFASKKGLEGKGLSIESVTPGMGNAEADAEGRVITVVLSNGVAIVNAYVPNAGMKLARLGYRTKNFEPEMRVFLRGLREKHRRVVYSGDLNVAHEAIDIHNSKGNKKSAGHTAEEREEMTNLLGEEWVDVFRHMYPNKRAYTYFSRRFGDRMKEQNKGNLSRSLLSITVHGKY